MLHPPPTDDLLARLYLHAVLPSLAELVALDPAARQAAGGRPWAVELRCPGGPAVRIRFDGSAIRSTDPDCGIAGADLVAAPIGRSPPDEAAAAPAIVDATTTHLASADAAPDRPAALALRFFSQRHAIRTFAAAGWLPPLPVGGYLRLGDAVIFSRLTGHLARTMAPGGTGPMRTRLLFGGLVARALAELCRVQPEASSSLDRFGAFLAALEVAGEVRSWFAHRNGRFQGGPGAPPGPVTVAIRFDGLDTAAQAADGALDQLAAVGAGEIEVFGLTPLADTLDVLLDRVGTYLT